MSKRRSHSSIESLPRALQDRLRGLLLDAEYPDDWHTDRRGKPTYASMVTYCKRRGHEISLSAFGRWAKRMNMMGRMKEAGLIARDCMQDLTGDKASQTQKAAAEMITAIVIDTVAGQENLKPKDVTMLAGAVKDCMSVAIKSDQYVREQVKKKAEKAEKEICDLGRRKKLDPETMKIIREQIYGIVS